MLDQTLRIPDNSACVSTEYAGHPKLCQYMFLHVQSAWRLQQYEIVLMSEMAHGTGKMYAAATDRLGYTDIHMADVAQRLQYASEGLILAAH